MEHVDPDVLADQVVFFLAQQALLELPGGEARERVDEVATHVCHHLVEQARPAQAT